MSFGGSGGGSGSIASSSDVVLNNPTDSQMLAYDSATSKWENKTAVGLDRTQHAVALGLYFPEAEGALADGVNDDSTAINNAITVAAAAGPGTRVVLNGAKTYALGDSIKLASGVRLEGQATLRMLASAVNRAILVSNKSNVQIADLTIDMNKATTANGGATTNQQGIYVSASSATISGVLITDVTVLNGWQRGIAAVASAGYSISDLSIEKCTVTGVNDAGIFVQGAGNADLTTPSASQRHTICDNHISAVGGVGIQAIGVSYADVSGNQLDGTGSTGHGICFSTSGSTSLVTDFTCNDNKIANFTYGPGNSKWGICVSVNCNRFTIAGNVIVGCAGGMTIDVNDAAFPGRTFDVQGTVRGNTIKGSFYSHGMNINGVENLAVTGNTHSGNAGGAGIACSNSRDCTIVGNQLRNNGTYGVAIFGTNSGTGGHTIGPNGTNGNASGAASTSSPPIACVFATTQSTP